MTGSKPRNADGQAVPQAAVSAAIFRQGRILLVKRARPPAANLWSFPGGHILPGERAFDAVTRELREETAISANILDVVGVQDVVQQNDRGVVIFHRVIIVFCGVWEAGEAKAGSDARCVAWQEKKQLGELSLTDGLVDMVTRAEKLLRWRMDC